MGYALPVKTRHDCLKTFFKKKKLSRGRTFHLESTEANKTLSNVFISPKSEAEDELSSCLNFPEIPYPRGIEYG